MSAAPLRPPALRPAPGAALRDALEALVAREGLRAACVLSAVGSLDRAMVRLADEPTPSAFDGPFEIVALSGTLSPDGAHLHVALADANGIVIGGHLGLGSIVRTTAELVVGELQGLEFSRVPDMQTGYRELVIRQGGR